MTNLEKYNQAFLESLDVTEDQLQILQYQDADWDSVGHMGLMAEIEARFEIEMDADDIIDFSSYEVGKSILKKYEIEI